MIKGIRYYSLMGSCGYGDAALAYMEGLIESGIPLCWSPLVYTKWGMAPRHMLPIESRPELGDIETGTSKRDELLQCLEKDIEYDTVFIHVMPELWPKLVESDKVSIGYTVWETDQLPSHWPDLIKSVNHICVPCEFNRDLFSIDMGPAVSVVPHAVRKPLDKCTDKDKMAFKHAHDISGGMYVFYIIATWDPRKAMIETLHAYLQAFDADDDVCFLIKTDKKGVSNDTSGMRMRVRQMVDEIVSNYLNPAKVILIADRIPEREIQLIHEIGDCFFSLTHCEGWGLGAFDAAASGNPVIVTGWGGQLDFLPKEASYSVEYTLGAVQEVRGWESYEKEHQWAYADINDATRQLRHCYNNRRESREKGEVLQAFVNKGFSKEQVNTVLIEAINAAHSR